MSLSNMASTTLRSAVGASSLAALLALVSCGPAQSNAPTAESLYAAKPYNFRLSLTDAPNDAIKSVFVNVLHAELHLTDGDKEARVIVARDLGLVDLLTLRDGVTLPMADLSIPEGVAVTQIRLVLDASDNHLIKSDGSRCDMQTPSGQQSGIKLLIKDAMPIEEGYSYSIVADFDALKSVVLQGNGGCLLKPVIKLKSATKVAMNGDGTDETPTTGGEGQTPTDGTDETTPTDGTTTDGSIDESDGSSTGDGTGWDDSESPTYPDVEPGELDEYF